MKKYLIPLIIIVVVVGALAISVISRPGSQNSNIAKTNTETNNTKTKDDGRAVSGNFTKGSKAPNFTFVDFNENKHTLSEFKGKAVILDFWAAWCPYCISELPELQKAQEENPNLVIIGIHRTDTESKDAGLRFATERGVKYLLVSDTDGSLYRAAGGFGMPVAVFIDKDQNVVNIKVGPKSAAEIYQLVAEIL